MNTFKNEFSQFKSLFHKRDFTLSIEHLVLSFKADSKATLFKLNKANLLYDDAFLSLVREINDLPTNYLLLFKIIQKTKTELESASTFIKNYSKSQILQGVANVLEKRNAELKFNASWNIKHANGDVRYLETERQIAYSSVAGIQVQELLQRFYLNANEKENDSIKIDQKSEQLFIVLLEKISAFNEIKDIIERHLFFEWTLEVLSENTIGTQPTGIHSEGRIETDIVNSLKSKIFVEGLNEIADKNLILHHLEKLAERPKPSEFWKHTPNMEDTLEMDWFAEATLLDIKAEHAVEWELALFKEKYFPSIKKLTDLELKNGEKLPLREAFIILCFIKEFAKNNINEIDEQYKVGVDYFSKLNPESNDLKMINHMSKLFKGDIPKQKEILNTNYNDKVLQEQTAVINGAKSMILDTNTLNYLSFDKLIKTIQWIHQFDYNFIKSVIEIFIYNKDSDFTKSPFFNIDNNLYWLPNTVAYVSFAENLIENLILNSRISIHDVQTKLYEASLNNTFKDFGYKIIENPDDKEFRGSDKKTLGDFDILAYKEGHLIYMELKLSNARNSYFNRWNWRNKALEKAVDQLEIGKKYILENEVKIKEILALNPEETINKMSYFILSNSNLYDHEKIGGFLKIGYFEATLALFYAETIKLDVSEKWKVETYLKIIENNLLFKHLQQLPKVDNNMRFTIGEYCIVRPGLIEMNSYTSL